MPTLLGIRTEIERMRVQIQRQRKDILSLQRDGISTVSAEALLARMHATVDDLCAKRDRLVAEASIRSPLKNGAR
jgi:hypothetical protein